MQLNKRALTALAIAVLFAGVVGVAGCSGDDATTDGTSGSTGTTVTEQDLTFSPAFLEVSVGDVVTFVNNDTVDHQVLIDGITLDVQAPGESVSWTAVNAQTIDYICTLHPSMMGRIDVK